MTSAISYPFLLDNFGVLNPAPTSNKIYIDRVLTLLSTNIGQRPMLPDYGVNWAQALFESESDASKAIPKALTSAIRSWVPDVKIASISIQNQQDGNEYVYLELVLPDNTTATLPINTATFNINGTVTQ
jgi:phage baseplate assembly protein W